MTPPPLTDWITAVLTAVNPTRLVQNRVQIGKNELTLGQYRHKLRRGRIFLISVGKAAVAMSQPILDLLDGRLTGGVIISKAEPAPATLPENVHFWQGGHPAPNEASVKAGTAVANLLRETQPDDLVICLVSGGASALMSQPRLPLADWQALNNALLASGCPIQEFNAVRQRLDGLKGGGLARLAAPAACVSLILSDVVGNPLDRIGSGPTVPSTADPDQARQILTHYNLADRLPASVWQTVTAALTDNPAAAPPDAAPLPDAPRHHEIIGDVNTAAQALATAVTQSGYDVRLLTTHLEGEAREVGKMAAALAKNLAPGQALILGGETTVTLRGKGMGGRNQELALSAAVALDGWPDRLILTLATDGEDGPTPAAGAWITGESCQQGRDMGLDAAVYLANNDSYPFFQQIAALIKSGPTGTNVNDLLLILSKK